MSNFVSNLRLFCKENQKLGFIAAIFLFATHYYQPNIGGSDLAIPFNLMVWCFIALQISLGLVVAANRGYIIIPSYLKYWLGGLILLSVPLLYDNAMFGDYALGRLLAICGLITFYLSLTQAEYTTKQKHLIIDLIIVAAAIEMLFSFAQLWLFPFIDFAHYKIPDRPNAIFQQPNVTASFYATAALLALSRLIQAHVISTTHTAAQTLKEHNGHYRKILYISVITATGFFLIVLVSRTAWLAMLTAMPLMAWLIHKYDQPLKSYIPILQCFIVGLLSGWLWLTIQESGTSMIEHKLANAGARKTDLYYIINMVSDNFLTGIGYGNFEGGTRQYFAEQWAAGDTFGLLSPHLTHPHNELLYWAAEGGIVPVIGLLIIAISIMFRVKQHNAIWFAACLPILFHSMLEYPFYHSITHAVVLVILIWLITERSSHNTQVKCHPSILKVPSLMVSILVIAFMLTGLHTHQLMLNYKLAKHPDLTQFSTLVNPLVLSDPYYFEVLTLRAMIGLNTGNLEDLKPYEAWAERAIPRTPRKKIIENQIKIKRALNKKSESEKLASLYQYWFPTAPLTPPLTAPVKH